MAAIFWKVLNLSIYSIKWHKNVFQQSTKYMPGLSLSKAGKVQSSESQITLFTFPARLRFKMQPPMGASWVIFFEAAIDFGWACVLVISGP